MNGWYIEVSQSMFFSFQILYLNCIYSWVLIKLHHYLFIMKSLSIVYPYAYLIPWLITLLAIIIIVDWWCTWSGSTKSKDFGATLINWWIYCWTTHPSPRILSWTGVPQFNLWQCHLMWSNGILFYASHSWKYGVSLPQFSWLQAWCIVHI